MQINALITGFSKTLENASDVDLIESNAMLYMAFGQFIIDVCIKQVNMGTSFYMYYLAESEFGSGTIAKYM